MGRIERIWLKRGRRGPMDMVPDAVLEEGLGLPGNTDRGGRRQVTIISLERWIELIHELGVDLDPSARRANLLVSGVDLEDSRGRLLLVGGCTLRIGGETRPCERMEEAHPGLQEMMRARWGGGAFAEVIRGGEIAVGDAVSWEPLLF